ncbi:TIGR04076 family protein [Nakamurella endophytica]|uniref:TIGR04076 family protein n=1 Tax=Nakamurella endophytica TaxID=1748367 RepID=A0A917T2L9_9ACTN|nr:TIGR04076 family protein [Nakamurella endophytica]GGM08242.1 hypothetical protein GCM10011594_30290 [Nakamurella endophytica]
MTAPEAGRAAPDAGSQPEGVPGGSSGADESAGTDAVTELYDLAVVVDRIEGRSVCGLEPGDRCEVTGSNRLTIPAGHHFCLYALAAVLPLLPAKQRRLPAQDWLDRDTEVACPDPDERVVLRIDRGPLRRYRTGDLT